LANQSHEIVTPSVYYEKIIPHYEGISINSEHISQDKTHHSEFSSESNHKYNHLNSD